MTEIIKDLSITRLSILRLKHGQEKTHRPAYATLNNKTLNSEIETCVILTILM